MAMLKRILVRETVGRDSAYESRNILALQMNLNSKQSHFEVVAIISTYIPYTK